MKNYVIIKIANAHSGNKIIYEKRYYKAFPKFKNIKQAQTSGSNTNTKNLY